MVMGGGVRMRKSGVWMKLSVGGGSELSDVEGMWEVYVVGKEKNGKGGVVWLEGYGGEGDRMYGMLEMSESGS